VRIPVPKVRITDLYSTGSTSVQRSLVALILAPVISSLVIVSAVILYFMLSIPASDPAPAVPQVIGGFAAVVFLGTILMGGPAAVIGMILIGLPAWLLLRYTNNESAAAYGALGALGGWWLAPQLGGHKWDSLPLNWLGAAGGALALIVFWRIARRR